LVWPWLWGLPVALGVVVPEVEPPGVALAVVEELDPEQAARTTPANRDANMVKVPGLL